MKLGSTLFLRIAVNLIGVPILALCIFGLPRIAIEAFAQTGRGSEFTYVVLGILFLMYISAIPFYFALYQALKLLRYIDKNEAFSQISVKALKNIRSCAILISVFYMVALPFIYVVAEWDDAPGLIVIGLIITFASMVIAVFAAVLKKLLQEAIDIKSENDLTV
ncbi:DUF2975 domain-containing protein [Pseudogracilibacillus sp. SO30301A]|uniref:DUF2975 domain-containing protein n=1 Tax=Pseudogracilibacillus sp. SO30301A TaxID=3098291 RepID=UPI00300E17D8